MLNKAEFDDWCIRNNLTEEALNLIQHIRNSEPVRKAYGARGNVIGRYPSRKMGMTIQFESHRIELAFIHEYDHEDDVLEFYDQASTIKLGYETPNGRHLGVLHTPDFFLIRSNSAGWEECKTEEKLIELASKSPNRYVKDTDGSWRCPPGEAYAEQFKFYYRLRSSKEINWIFQRNIEFLDDYYRRTPSTLDTDRLAALLTYTTQEPGVTLKELFEHMYGLVSRDDIFKLIAYCELYVDLKDAPLIEDGRVRVFPNRETAIAYSNLVQTTAQDNLYIPPLVSFDAGSIIQWDGKGWVVVNVGETMIGLLGNDKEFTEIPISAFEKLICEGRITSTKIKNESRLHPEAKKRLEQADKNEYREANRRYDAVRAYLCRESILAEAPISPRTLRDWVAKYRKAQELYGHGYIGLITCKRRGNTTDKLSEATRQVMNEFIENDYETHKQKRKSTVYSMYSLACQRRGLIPASYKTFCRAIKQRSQYSQTLKRRGRKAAYTKKEFYWELTPTIPPHGERPLHIAHIDHTELDAELVCSITGNNFGRAWATFLTDAFSRRLAVYLTYDPPSYRSCMMILRECVRRFGRLPQIIVVDGGREFSGTYFETLLAWYECTKKTRPPSEGRFGSICEKLFGTTNTRFIHNLQGNTQIMRNARQVTKSLNPKNNAVWTLELLYLYMRQWAYEIYDTIEHPALGQSPRDAYARGMVIAGERAHRLIPYSDEFRLLTLPSTAKTTAKIWPGKGVKINNIYYWSDSFRHPGIEGTRVSVRYDPYDIGSGFAFVHNRWEECHSSHYRTFRGRSERELKIATEELRKRNKRHSRQSNITAFKMAQFLESVESEELLSRQRMADRESLSIIKLVNNEAAFGDATHISTDIIPSAEIVPNSSPIQQSVSETSCIDELKVYGEF